MVTVDDLTALQTIARQTYWVCRSFHKIVLESDDKTLDENRAMLKSRLKEHQYALAKASDVALSTVKQAVAIERLPTFTICGDSVMTATEGAFCLVIRLVLCCTPGAHHMKEVVEKVPAFNYDAAIARVDEEWSAAVRLLNRATPTEPRRHEEAVGGQPPVTEADLDVQAATVKALHPELTDEQVANQIGCSRTTLYKPKFKKYREVKRALAETREDYRPNGSRPDRRRRRSNINKRDADEL
jgi:hypothetical protein